MKKYDDDLEFGSLNEDSRDSRFILPIIIVAVLLVIVIAALVLIGKNGKNKDTSADPMATEQSETTEAEAQTTEVMGTIEATESAEEADADDPQGSNMGNETGASVDVTALLSAGSVAESGETTFGIDVARYQGTIDWTAVSNSEVDFAMIRVGYRGRSDGLIKEDPNGRYNLQEAAKVEIPMGAYFFSTAISQEEAQEEADWMAETLAGYPITYPVVYDCEGFKEETSRQFSMTKQERTDVALAFLSAIEKHGYEGMFYASKGELEGENDWETARIADKYKIWVAQYPAQPYPDTPASTYNGTHQMWQYTTNGEIRGIRQPVDMNIAYFGYDGIEPAKSKKTPAQAEPDVEAMMDFTEVSEQVTARDETNMRNIPSQGDDSVVLFTLKNGEIAQRIAVSTSGWSKILYEGNIYYAVSSYLTTDLGYTPPDEKTLEQEDGIQTQFTAVNDVVTAKKVVNLRKLPSVEHEDAVVLAQLQAGDTAKRVGISENGWSKLEYQGMTCYAVTSYLKIVGEGETQPSGQVQIQTQFEDIQDQVTAKVEVNLRSLPSVEDPSCVVVATLKNGEIVTRTGINRDVGWSRVIYNGQTLYCVSNYLTAAG